MAILDDFTVDYTDKKITHTSGTTIYTVNALYSALQDLFDEPDQMDDTVPMSAQTPTEYSLINEWFMDDVSTNFLQGGAIQSTDWTRVESSHVGIVRVPIDRTIDPVVGDVGKTIVHDPDGDSGTLLGFELVTGSLAYLYIRPDSDAIGNSFNSASGNLDVTAGTANVGNQTAAAVSDEELWANPFSLGTLVSNTQLYIAQAGSVLTPWWTPGQIDILVRVRDQNDEIDDAVITVFARRATSLYDHFEIDLTSGGRQPVPLAMGTDLNDTLGNRQMIITTGATAEPVVGEIIEDDTDATIQGVITTVVGTNPNVTLDYYLIGQTQNDFTGATGALTGQTSGFTATSVAPTSVNGGDPANDGGGGDGAITVTHANTTVDIGNGSGSRKYSITIDCNANPLSNVYAFCKYNTRRGETGTGFTDGQEGQQYIGIDQVVKKSAAAVELTEGFVITGGTSGATGVVVGNHTGATAEFTVRNSRDGASGPFSHGETITDTGSGSITADINSTESFVITPIKVSPFGTFAGGTFFAAPGVALTNVAGADAQNYQLIDDKGVVQVPPNAVAVTITSLIAGDVVSVFVLTGSGGTIDKAQHNLAAGNNLGDTDVVVDSTIPADTPTSSVVRIVDDGGTFEHRYRFSSFTGTTFTLDSLTGLTADGAGCTATQITDTGANFITNGVKKGDFIRNTSETVVTDIVSVDSETVLQTGAGVTDWTSDNYEINALTQNYDATDDAYVPIIDDSDVAGTSVSATLTHSTDIFTIVRVRKGKVILPFETPGTVESGGLTVAAIRTTDTIAV